MPETVNIEKFPLVSVVIPMRNERETIVDCINSVLSQDYPKERIEILVVDGGSDDGSEELVGSLSQEHGNIFLYNNPKGSTPSGLNIGVRKSRGSVIIILGAHSMMAEDFIPLDIKYLEEKDVKCVGGTTVNVGSTFTQQAIGLAMSSPFGISSAPYRYSSKAQFVDTVIYGAYRREVFEELGLFEEKGFISEDAEFNWRLRKAGHKIYFTPEIKTFYYPRKSIPKLLKQFFNYGILRINVIKKHLDAIKIAHLLPSLLLLSIASCFGLSFLNKNFVYLLLALSGTYLAIIMAGTIQFCFRKGWKYLVILPLIFMTLHFSFGTGFLVGLLKRR